MPTTTSLNNVTRDLLRNDGRPLKDIARASRLPYFWLKKYSAGETRAPGVDRVQKLYEFLSHKKLPL